MLVEVAEVEVPHAAEPRTKGPRFQARGTLAPRDAAPRRARGWLAASCLTALAACVDDAPLPSPDVEIVADPDRVDAACTTGPRTPGPCAPGAVAQLPSRGAGHVREPTPITYEDSPPSSGDHRPAWAKWGEYDYLAPQRWLHNLEHGGVAFLYDPCAPAAMIDALRSYALGLPDDESGPFRWVLTPYPGLPTPVAAVTWGWTWQAECVDATSLEAFVTEHYRQAPEDFAGDGSYETGWIQR